MTAYVDTSALLRLVIPEGEALEQLRTFDSLVSSEIIAVEALRTIDRLRMQGALTADEASARARLVAEWLEAIDLVLLRGPVLSRAAHPLPVALGTLDAIHLATALVWQERTGERLVLATHDAALAGAARAYSFDVVGA